MSSGGLNRQNANREIIKILSEIIEKHPYYRFGQILFNYNICTGRDPFYDESIDMVTSVMPAKCNPYYDGFEDNDKGLLTISKGDGTIERRQDAPCVWQQNGAVYIINPSQLKAKGLAGMTKIRKYVIDEIHSVDLDTMFDWKVAELMLNEGLVK